MEEVTLLERMKAALQEAKEENKELMELVINLTSTPLSYGTVIRVGNKNPVPRAPRTTDFTKGTKVKVKVEALERYPDVKFPNGTVRDVKGMNVSVRLVQGGTQVVEMSDLDLQDPKTEEIPTVTASLGGSIVELVHPKALPNLKEGDCVLVNKYNMIASVAPTKRYGSSVIVKEVLEDRYCQITEADKDRTVFVGDVGTVEKGDHVILDPEGAIIVKNNRQQTTEYTVETKMDVKWDEIGGLAETKEQIYEMVELPHRNPDIFKHYKKSPSKGILFFGPPGCGKTMIAKAVATSLANIYGGNLTESGFIYIKGPEILNPYVGVTEQTIREIFQRARKHKEKTGYPATIFIDEADAILSKRGSGISSDVDKTIVPMFLTEMDGLNDSAAFVILATNRADVLDPAVMREGRIDVKVKIDRPDRDASYQIVLINLKKTPVKDNKREELAKYIVSEIFASNLKNTVSGASLAGLVDQAIGEAIRRDIKAGGKPTGVTIADVESAIQKLEAREKALKPEMEHAKEER